MKILSLVNQFTFENVKKNRANSLLFLIVQEGTRLIFSLLIKLEIKKKYVS